MKARRLLIGGLLIGGLLVLGCATAPVAKPTPAADPDPVASAMLLCDGFCAAHGRLSLGMVINAVTHKYNCACALMPGEAQPAMPEKP